MKKIAAAHTRRFTSDGCFSPLCLLKGFISPGDRLFSKHLIILVLQGHLTTSLCPAESAECTEFWETHKKLPQTAPAKSHKPESEYKKKLEVNNQILQTMCSESRWSYSLDIFRLMTEQFLEHNVILGVWKNNGAEFGLSVSKAPCDWLHTWGKG